MCTAKTLYLEELRASADAVSNGQVGAILNNGKLMHDYTSDMLEMILNAIEHGEDAVKAELVMLLANVHASEARDKVAELSGGASEAVSAACDAYAKSIRENEDTVRKLISTLERTTGEEFHEAAVRLAPIVGENHLRQLENIYLKAIGGNIGDMKALLQNVIRRYPHLDSERDQILGR